ncbi:MAG: alpha/beta hydrolase [Planctomycetales bacterium]|nr:alpha/beta hydrolase [Planctomycetales bacterium]
MPLDPELAPLLETPALPYSQLPVEEARRLMLVASQPMSSDAPLQEQFDTVAELPGRSIPLRVYRPHRATQGSSATEARPHHAGDGALVYFHGGGWVLGSIVTHDAYCHALAAESGVTIVSVDYRLAPEAPYPAAADDAIEVTEWILRQAESLKLDASRIGVGGDSAGGNLAAVATQHLRDSGQPPLACQVLIYPIVDCDTDTASYRENGAGYLLTHETMEWFWELYAADPQRRSEPKASPLRQRDLRGLPPALVLTAEYDPLRDEGEMYARRLADSGGDVELKRYDGMVHGFVRRTRELQAARRAMRHVSQFLQRHL